MSAISLIAVGRMKPGPLLDLAAIYRQRLTWPVEIIEIELKGKFEGELLKMKEAEAIIGRLPAGAILVALDERGKARNSPDFAKLIETYRRQGPLAFVIGGPDGMDETIRQRASLVLSFGQLTWPHMLARVMLLEQIYRAQQILAGHPYHRV
jgi:23S rRNA (pseudouridine1915-N3)-methyltransferase